MVSIGYTISLRILRLEHLSQAANGRPGSHTGVRRHLPRTSSHGLLTSLALPDADSLTLGAELATERAAEPRVGQDLEFLGLLSERRTVARAVLANDTDFLSVLAHCHCRKHLNACLFSPFCLWAWIALCAF